MSGQSPMEHQSIGDESSPNTNKQTGSQLGHVNATNPVTPDMSSGKVLVDGNDTTYIGATHWAAILEDIEEVKGYFQEEVEEEEEEYWPTAALCFDVESPATRFDLLAELPSRPVVDRLVSRYFNSNSPALPWLGLLYAMLVIATFSALSTGEEHLDDRGPPFEMIQSYRKCCVQALVLSHYTRPGPYTLEALMIYMEGEFLLSSVDQVQSYLLVGNVVRLAMRMGLHRDSSKVGSRITPFQGEMRRRAWHHLKQIDLLASFHIGLPSMMQAVDSDTLYPRNLRDEDLDENMIELPASRSDSEFTPVSYMISKSRICDISCKIATLANLLTLPAYADVMRLDSLLLEAHSQLPHFFQLPSSGFPVTDAPERIVKRISLELLFQKSRCMLHRKYLVKADGDARYSYSKEAGLDASLKLLHVQTLAHEAAQPGGLLSRDRWFLSTLSIHDFLLAAMIVYLTIIRNIGKHVDPDMDNGFTAEQQKTVAILEESYRIWTQNANPSVEVKRASAVLKVMLKKVSLALGQSSHDPRAIPQDTIDRCNDHASSLLSSNIVSNLLTGDASVGGSSSSLLPPSNVLPITTSSDTTPSSGHDLFFDADFSTFKDMAAMPNDFNWEMFDNQIRPQQMHDQVWPDFTEDFAAMNDDYYNFDLN
ncbi:hypothetical protein EG329_012586 [Mollisiaceae sp. DMI_Dod_QoI]|nr:hypothetical protein EG329_012586 [Helotiales sp. DMI_Dod_QoI]